MLGHANPARPYDRVFGKLHAGVVARQAGYYGVNSDSALAMRMVGVPREAATKLARTVGTQGSLSSLRERLLKDSETIWTRALGSSGKTYLAIWRQLEGL